jgi:hypothetical protein
MTDWLLLEQNPVKQHRFKMETWAYVEERCADVVWQAP